VDESETGFPRSSSREPRLYFREDNLHLNDSGYAKWWEILEPMLCEEWEEVKNP
jgi:lysophospholipase L1-like esterase